MCSIIPGIHEERIDNHHYHRAAAGLRIDRQPGRRRCFEDGDENRLGDSAGAGDTPGTGRIFRRWLVRLFLQ